MTSPSPIDLALDHLTAVDAVPIELAVAARAADCNGIYLFLQSLDVLSLMPRFDLIANRSDRRELQMRLVDLRVALKLAYPFTLSSRSAPADLRAALDCAAELGAPLINVHSYDRDPPERFDHLAKLGDLAAQFGLGMALEFYPASQVRSLAEARDLVAWLDRPGRIGINVDLLHLMRSGGSFAELAALPQGTVLFAQYADGPESCPPEERAFEASSARLCGGEGHFDLAGFARALSPHCPASVEIPRDALAGRAPVSERVHQAVDSVRRQISPQRATPRPGP